MACLLDLGWWGPVGTDYRVRLRKAWDNFCAWRSRNKLASSQRPFTSGMLFKAQHGAYLVGKGFNSKILAAWLAEEAKLALDATANPSSELTLMTHAMLLGPL